MAGRRAFLKLVVGAAVLVVVVVNAGLFGPPVSRQTVATSSPSVSSPARTGSAGLSGGTSPTPALNPARGAVGVRSASGGAGTLNATEAGLGLGTVWNVTVTGNSDGVQGVIDQPGVPRGFAYDPENQLLYVAVSSSNETAAINTTTHTVVATIPVGLNPRRVGYDPLTGDLLVPNSLSNNVTVISGANNTVVGSVPVGNTPIGIAFVPSNGLVYVVNSAEGLNASYGNVTVLNGTTLAPVTVIPAGNDPRDLTYDPVNGLLYVADYGGANLTVVDPSTNTVVGSIATNASTMNPAVDPATGYLYLDVAPLGTVEVFDPANNTTVAFLPVGSYPSIPVYDPENGLIYVGNDFSANVSVIDPSVHRVIGSIPLGNYPATVGIDPVTDTVYVSNWYDGTIAYLNGSAAAGGAAVVPVAPVNGSATVTSSLSSHSIAIHVPDGLYNVTFGPVQNHGFGYCYPTVGITVLDNRPASLCEYLPTPSNLTFTESGLPAGKRWSVYLDRSWVSTTTGSISFPYVLPGNHTYLIVGPNGYQVQGLVQAGTLTVGSPWVNETFSFVRGPTRAVTFAESGLPVSFGIVQRWCVNFTVDLCTQQRTLHLAGLNPGSYAYAIGPLTGQEITAKSAGVSVSLAGALNLSLRSATVRVHYVYPYAVTFRAAGLPAGYPWSVTVHREYLSTSGPSVGFSLPNGSYPYKAYAPDYEVTTSPLSVHVQGFNVTVTVNFAPLPALPSIPASAALAPGALGSLGAVIFLVPPASRRDPE